MVYRVARLFKYQLCLSLIAHYCTGLMIGKKGPFVHVSAMIANLLSKLRPFRLIREVRSPPPPRVSWFDGSVSLESATLSTNARCGLWNGCIIKLWRSDRRYLEPIFKNIALVTPSDQISLPLIGVLFSIEVTSTYYPVRNYVLAFQCAVISAISYQFVR